MSVFRLVLGVVWLTFGIFVILARDQIVARHRRRGEVHPQPPMLWIVLGGLYLILGVCWTVSAFV